MGVFGANHDRRLRRESLQAAFRATQCRAPALAIQRNARMVREAGDEEISHLLQVFQILAREGPGQKLCNGEAGVIERLINDAAADFLDGDSDA